MFVAVHQRKRMICKISDQCDTGNFVAAFQAATDGVIQVMRSGDENHPEVS